MKNSQIKEELWHNKDNKNWNGNSKYYDQLTTKKIENCRNKREKNQLNPLLLQTLTEHIVHVRYSLVYLEHGQRHKKVISWLEKSGSDLEGWEWLPEESDVRKDKWVGLNAVRAWREFCWTKQIAQRLWNGSLPWGNTKQNTKNRGKHWELQS